MHSRSLVNTQHITTSLSTPTPQLPTLLLCTPRYRMAHYSLSNGSRHKLTACVQASDELEGRHLALPIAIPLSDTLQRSGLVSLDVCSLLCEPMHHAWPWVRVEAQFSQLARWTCPDVICTRRRSNLLCFRRNTLTVKARFSKRRTLLSSYNVGHMNAHVAGHMAVGAFI